MEELSVGLGLSRKMVGKEKEVPSSRSQRQDKSQGFREPGNSCFLQETDAKAQSSLNGNRT